MKCSNKISIVTITRNNANGLCKTIKSVELQKRMGATIEFIVIDGASTDHTPQVLKSYDNIIDIGISEKDDGIYDAMNKGLAIASGDSIFFLNAGDRFFLPFNLSKLQNKYALNKYIVLCKTIQRYGEDAYLRPSCRRFNSMHGSFGHQGVFVPKIAYKNAKYPTEYPISADSVWMKKVSKLAPVKYCENVCAVFELGGISNNSSLMQAKLLAAQPSGTIPAIKACIKYVLKLVLGSRLLYRILFWKKYDFIKGQILDQMENPQSCYSWAKDYFKKL